MIENHDFLSDFTFESHSHMRIQCGEKMPLQKDKTRIIKIQDNISGLHGYTVTIYNGDGNHPLWGDNIQLAPKRMEIIEETSSKIVLRGYGYDERALAMGIRKEDAAFSDYGFEIHRLGNTVTKCVLVRYFDNVKIVYYSGFDGESYSKLSEIVHAIQSLENDELSEEQVNDMANGCFSQKELYSEPQYEKHLGMQFVQINDFVFYAKKFVEYCNGQIIDSGIINMKFNFINISQLVETLDEGYDYKVRIIDNCMQNKLISEFKFDECLAVNDRLMLLCSPEETNVDIPIVWMLSSSIGYTRHSKIYKNNEPVVCSLFTVNNNVKKISFTIAKPSPERLIEFI